MKLVRQAALALGLTAGLGLASIQTAHAQACSGGAFGGLLSSLPSSCQVGDKIYSNFSHNFVGGTPLITINEAPSDPNQHNLTINLGSVGTGTFFNYTISVASGSPNYIKTWQTDTQGGIAPNNYQVDVNWTPDALGPVTLVYSPPGPSGSGVQNFTGQPLSVSVTHDFTNISTLTSFSDTITQAPVPGPLPILGAGAAFGFSRKLRNRIKASV